MKRIGFLLLFLPFVLSCGTGPQATDPIFPDNTVEPILEPALEPVVEPVVVESTPQPSAPPEEKAFDPGTISQERYQTAKTDVQVFIADLNRIIRARNYNAWRGFLSDSYFREISSSAFLEEKTEELYRRDQTVATNMGRNPRLVQKKILRTPRDYFDNVVVPSRSNDRVDDIAFISENRVKAYTEDNRGGNRLVLYDLEIIDGKWKIIQ